MTKLDFSEQRKSLLAKIKPEMDAWERAITQKPSALDKLLKTCYNTPTMRESEGNG